MKYVQCSPFLTVKGNVDFNLFYEIERCLYTSLYLHKCVRVCVWRERDPKRDEYKLLVQNNNNSRNTNV